MTHGFKFISEMTKEEMIEEIVACNREMLEASHLSKKSLASMVVDARVESLRRKLNKEAGLACGHLDCGSDDE